MKVLGDRVIESAEPAVSAADMWLALSQPERDATAVFASGRATRAEIHQRLQDGLGAEGSAQGEHIQHTVSTRDNPKTEGTRSTETVRGGTSHRVGRGGAREG